MSDQIILGLTVQEISALKEKAESNDTLELIKEIAELRGQLNFCKKRITEMALIIK